MMLHVSRNIRVFVEDVPELVRDLLRHAISSQPDMELVQGRIDPVPVETSDPDVVVATQRAADVQSVSRILARWPRSEVLMITVDGRQAALFQLKPHRTELLEMSPAELTNAIRAAVRQRWL